MRFYSNLFFGYKFLFFNFIPMRLLNRLTWRHLSYLVVAAMLMSLLSFSSISEAANPTLSFNTDPDGSTFEVYSGNPFEFDVHISPDGCCDLDTALTIEGPMELAPTIMEIEDGFWYLEEDHVFTWDGKFGTQYVAPGTYEYSIQGQEIEGTFDVSNELTGSITVTGPVDMSLSPLPMPYYSGSGDDVMFDFDVVALAEPVCLNLRVDGELQGFATVLAPGNHSISWDGELGGGAAASGTYDWRVYADDLFCVGTSLQASMDLLVGQVEVDSDVQPTPVVSNLAVDPDPFDPTGPDAELSFELAGSVGNTEINAEIYPIGNPGSPVQTWDMSDQSNGAKNMVWDGMDGGSDVPDGKYVFKVWGTDGSYEISAQELIFDVEVPGAPDLPEPPPLPEPQNCGGYSDVAANHSDCDAIEYMQDIGAMTGNPNGTFGPNDLLQRDQVARISQETFNLFDDSADYCGGSDPFPDMVPAQWSYQYVCRGVQLGVIFGFSSGPNAGLFAPGQSVNRVEFLALVLRNVSDTLPPDSSTSYADVDPNQWFSGYAKYSLDLGLFAGLNLNPTQGVSRAEVANVIYKLFLAGKV